MKRIIISLVFIIIAVSVFVAFRKFNNYGRDFNAAMQAYNTGNYGEAYKQLLPLAKAGNDVAQNNLGNLYARGLGVKQNYQQAILWYKKSIEQGSTDALTNLAVMYQSGLGVEKDVKKAIKMYETAIKDNNPAAFNNLGYIYIYMGTMLNEIYLKV